MQRSMILFLVTLVARPSSATFAVQPPVGYEPIPELSDEFDTEVLDRSKWSTDRSVVGWSGRQPGLFDPANVIVGNGTLQLWARAAKRNASWPHGFDNYTTAAIHSLARVREGFFEVRWRSGSSGISSSWWLHQSTDDTWTEIDVFETTGAPNGLKANASNLPSHVHIFKLPHTPASELPNRCHCKLYHSSSGQHRCTVGALADPLPTDETFASRFHVASLNWTSTGVTIAIDGRVVNRLASPCLIQDIGMDVSVARTRSRQAFNPVRPARCLLRASFHPTCCGLRAPFFLSAARISLLSLCGSLIARQCPCGWPFPIARPCPTSRLRWITCVRGGAPWSRVGKKENKKVVRSHTFCVREIHAVPPPHRDVDATDV